MLLTPDEAVMSGGGGGSGGGIFDAGLPMPLSMPVEGRRGLGTGGRVICKKGGGWIGMKPAKLIGGATIAAGGILL